jgi:hypothetical protein
MMRNVDHDSKPGNKAEDATDDRTREFQVA